MKQILLMTLAGSILWAGYLFLEKRKGDCMTQGDRYRTLVIVMLTYLIPWVWMKDVYRNVTFLVRSRMAVTVSSSEIFVDLAAIEVAEGTAMTVSYGICLIALSVWIGGAALKLFQKVVRYLQNKKMLLQIAQNCNQSFSNDVLKRLKKEYHLWGGIRILQIRGFNKTVTIGLFRPVILLQDDCTQEDIELILRHEFTHISRGDSLMKVLIELVTCIHWFNPAVYSLERLFERICETSCDERVIKKCANGDEMAQYALLIKDSMKAPKWKLMGSSSLSSSSEFAKERVNLIMQKKKIGRIERLAVAGVFAFMLFLDSLTALAYPTVYHVADENGVLNGEVMEQDIRVVTDLGESTYGSTVEDILYDRQLVDAEGNIIPVPEVQARGILCIHAYDARYYQTHERDDDGNCVVRTYTCDFCPKCGNIIIHDLYSEVIYRPCPHD